ncbi:unnamed protein product [Urochloa humidicola]
MEQDAPPPPPPPTCTSSAAAAAVTGVGDPSSSLAETLRRLMSSARPELHSSPPPPPQPTTSSTPAAAAGVGDPSSSAHVLRCLASSPQPEQLTHYSSPSFVPPPPPTPWSSESASASASSSAAVPSYQQKLPPPAPVLDGSSLPQPPSVFSSFNTVGNIISTDLEAATVAAASQLAEPLQSHGGHQGQSTDNLFGVTPSASEEHSSFLSSPGPGTMGNALFPHPGVSPPHPGVSPAAATPLAMAHPSLLGGKQPQALPRTMTPGMLFGQRNNFSGFGKLPMLGSSSREADLPPRWQPSGSRTQKDPTTGSVLLDPKMRALMGPFEATQGQSSSSSWERRLQQLSGGAHTLSAWSTSGAVSNGRSSAAIFSTEPRHCRNLLSRDSSTMSSMLNPPSVGDEGSPGLQPPSSKRRNKRRGDTFTDAEMEKIKKEKRLSDLVMTEPRRVKTILCNRASAAKSAERKENHRRGLQQQLQALDTQYSKLHDLAILEQEKLAELESQISKLRMRLEDLGNELNLKEAINETLISSIQSITLADSNNAWSGLPRQMTFDGQCSNGGQYQDMRTNPPMSSQMVHMHQPPEIQEELTIATTT